MLPAFKYGLKMKKIKVCPNIYMSRPIFWDELVFNVDLTFRICNCFRTNMNLRLLVWFSAILFGIFFSAMFIYDWVNQWIQRPFEKVKTKILKQSIPFPSITLCLEGTTLWPAVQSYLEQFEVCPNEIPKVSDAFLRLKAHATMVEARKEFRNERERLSPFCKSDYKICKFVFFVTILIDKKIQKSSLEKAVDSLVDDLQNSFYSKEESDSFYKRLYNVRSEVYYFDYKNSNVTERKSSIQQQNLGQPIKVETLYL